MQLFKKFSFFLLLVHGLCGVIIILAGPGHTNNENENPTPEKIHFSFFVMITGWLLVIWTIFGWFTLVKKTRELDIICVFLNIAMMILQGKFFCTLFASTEFHVKNILILVAVFAAPIISSAIHLLIFIFKCKTKYPSNQMFTITHI